MKKRVLIVCVLVIVLAFSVCFAGCSDESERLLTDDEIAQTLSDFEKVENSNNMTMTLNMSMNFSGISANIDYVIKVVNNEFYMNYTVNMFGQKQSFDIFVIQNENTDLGISYTFVANDMRADSSTKGQWIGCDVVFEDVFVDAEFFENPAEENIELLTEMIDNLSSNFAKSGNTYTLNPEFYDKYQQDGVAFQNIQLIFGLDNIKMKIDMSGEVQEEVSGQASILLSVSDFGKTVINVPTYTEITGGYEGISGLGEFIEGFSGGLNAAAYEASSEAMDVFDALINVEIDASAVSEEGALTLTSEQAASLRQKVPNVNLGQNFTSGVVSTITEVETNQDGAIVNFKYVASNGFIAIGSQII